MVISLDLPDGNERISQIQKFIKMYSGRFTIDWQEQDVIHAAALLRGFSEIQIENMLASEITGIEKGQDL